MIHSAIANGSDRNVIRASGVKQLRLLLPCSLLASFAMTTRCRSDSIQAHLFFSPPKSRLIAEPTPSTTPPAPSKPLWPRVPRLSAALLMFTPSFPAIAVAMRVDKFSLSEKFGLLVSPLRVKSMSMTLLFFSKNQ